jgi:hypothetical protein
LSLTDPPIPIARSLEPGIATTGLGSVLLKETAMDEQKYASLVRWVLGATSVMVRLQTRLGVGLHSIAREMDGLIGGFIVEDKGVSADRGPVRFLMIEAHHPRARSARR